ncbi:hypothetical protein Asi02nite_50230 [Asanoa siamensis]|uniref:Uncharacterized protein n=1 Tax=Asanoa siamensis TaxID=926357 RepID=A0ABQ4CW63_9ACTN|nr:hypothetical protein Asi02nite_50230 [Asanoa siamensis]
MRRVSRPPTTTAGPRAGAVGTGAAGADAGPVTVEAGAVGTEAAGSDAGAVKAEASAVGAEAAGSDAGAVESEGGAVGTRPAAAGGDDGGIVHSKVTPTRSGPRPRA